MVCELHHNEKGLLCACYMREKKILREIRFTCGKMREQFSSKLHE